MNDERSYRGNFVNGKFHDDNAVYTYKSGKQYTGAFNMGKKHGKGVVLMPNKSTYEGHWENDKEIGACVYTDGKTGESVIGTWDMTHKSFVPKMSSQIPN